MNIGAINKSELFTGKIDEIRIYNRVLTQKEIDKLKNLN
jgi:hypothetical protein